MIIHVRFDFARAYVCLPDSTQLKIRYILGLFLPISPHFSAQTLKTTIAERINNIHLAIMTDFGAHSALRIKCNPFHVWCA